jgi:sulfite exporter TauE/SafE
MQSELQILLITAITIACLHTITGPDHYLPFIALSKARGWSFIKTLSWTIICGCGHVWSSVLLALGGAAIGWNLSKIHFLENVRGGIAGWFMLLFGLLYGTWGLWRAFKNKTHKHFDTYEDGDMYVYEHKHGQAIAPTERHKVTPWVMFIIFLLGPCEPMIPLLYFPAARHSWNGMLLLIITYTLVTLLTMIAMVILGYYGLAFLKTDKLEKYMHALGGLTLLICGAGMVFMNW